MSARHEARDETESIKKAYVELLALEILNSVELQRTENKFLVNSIYFFLNLQISFKIYNRAVR